ncbi:MAG: ABC transporter permease, partial [Methanobacteriota archaeon]
DSLWVVVAGTGFLVALLLHNLFSLELKARSRDFGVLRAVGATPREVAGLLSARAMFLAGIGLAIGTAGVLGGLRLAPTFVAEAARFASPSGRTLLVVAGVVLVSAAAGAGLVVARVLRTPARRLLGGSP